MKLRIRGIPAFLRPCWQDMLFIQSCIYYKVIHTPHQISTKLIRPPLIKGIISEQPLGQILSLQKQAKMDQSELLEQNTSRGKQQEAYKKIKVLGQGSMGKAYLVQSNSDHQLYVMKRINIGHLSAEQKQTAMREAQLHSIVQHPNIIAFKQIYHTTKEKLCIIMEYAENGDLDQFIQQQNGKFLPEDVVLNYFSQICLGLKQIHSKKIIHRDLKGANIFLTKNMTVKIGDFGISKAIDQTVQASKSFVGTPYYLSPEMVEGKPYSTKADIWALGVLLYHMCSQKLPFQANSLPLLALRILKGSFPPLSGPYSRQMKALVLSMLQVDAKKRPSVVDILSKPLLSKYIPKEEVQKIQSLQQKLRIPKNPTVANLTSPSVKGQTLGTTKVGKKSNKPQITQQQRKQKQKDLKEEKKKKRDQQIKQMRDDIRKKRLQAQKQKSENTHLADTVPIPKPISKKAIELQRSPIKDKVESQPKQPIEKPWKTVKNKGGSKKQLQYEILLPPVKSKQIKKEPEVPAAVDFKIQIKEYGKKYSSPTGQIKQTPEHINKSQKQIQKKVESQEEQCESVQQEVENQQEESEEVDFHKMMDHLNHAQEVVKGLKLNPSKQIQLYEQSENFDEDMSEYQKNKKPQTPQMLEMNTIEEDSWNLIHNSDNLEECRQILEDGLGEERFMKAYRILNEHLDESEQKKMRGEELEDYTFNREVLRDKLDFLTDKEFKDYVVLMYTLIVIELEEMKKNLEDQS